MDTCDFGGGVSDQMVNYFFVGYRTYFDFDFLLLFLHVDNYNNNMNPQKLSPILLLAFFVLSTSAVEVRVLTGLAMRGQSSQPDSS